MRLPLLPELDRVGSFVVLLLEVLTWVVTMEMVVGVKISGLPMVLLL